MFPREISSLTLAYIELFSSTHVSLLFSKWYYISEFFRECLHHVLWFFHAKEVNTNIRKLMYTIKNYLLIDLECRLFLFRMLFGNLYFALSRKYYNSYRQNKTPISTFSVFWLAQYLWLDVATFPFKLWSGHKRILKMDYVTLAVGRWR